VDEKGMLLRVTERLRVENRPGGPAFTEDEGQSYTALHPDTTVSMNLFGFQYSILGELGIRFAGFLEEGIRSNPLKCEYLLPRVTDRLVQEGRASLKVLSSLDSWYGVTYRQDLPAVRTALARMQREGKYPSKLWE